MKERVRDTYSTRTHVLKVAADAHIHTNTNEYKHTHTHPHSMSCFIKIRNDSVRSEEIVVTFSFSRTSSAHFFFYLNTFYLNSAITSKH